MTHSTITLKVAPEIREALKLAAKSRKQTMKDFVLSVILMEAVLALKDEEAKLTESK